MIKSGLLKVERKNSQRYYSEKDIVRLQNIIAMKEMMFYLDDIKRILEIDERIDKGLKDKSINPKDIEILLNEVKQKQTELMEKERKLKKVKCQLDEIVNKIMEFKSDAND